MKYFLPVRPWNYISFCFPIFYWLLMKQYLCVVGTSKMCVKWTGGGFNVCNCLLSLFALTELSRGPRYRACYHGYTMYVWSTYGRGGGRGATGAGVGEAGDTGPLHGNCWELASRASNENLHEDWSFTGSPSSALTFETGIIDKCLILLIWDTIKTR